MKSANQKIEKGDMTMYISIKKLYNDVHYLAPLMYIFTMYISTNY